MYPVLPFLDRECNADYKIPGTNVVIDKGSRIYIPMLGLHYDEKYFSKPEEYNPDRFYDKKSYNENGLYYIPFGEGPRICIGERFGMLGSKLGLAYIISHFIIERTPDTPVPVEFQPKAFVLQSKVGLPMKFKEITPQLA
ncbi:hypothetical protein NQ318_003751 [Aromia moschata]|uniref:Cytochrome P450 n=1 Tax=Aromia moschata TaxID=1265417 RepID=A0AAV8YK97_9CUCU|nr:hypothetical protein NQ318_003751 [Aromia moschata]